MSSVLVIDDDKNIAEGLGEVLELEGFTVSVAMSAAEARVRFAADKPKAVVSDLQLPDGDGLSLAMEFRKQNPSLIIYISSGRSFLAEERARADLAGITEIVPKPLDIPSLCAKLKKIK